MSYSHVYFNRKTNIIHLWEFENGEKVYKKLPAPLYFFIRDENGEYKTIYGDNAKKVEFSSYSEMRKKAESLKEVGMDVYESDVPIETKFIVENYAGQELVIPKQIDIHFMDIEVHSDEGFPKPEHANGEITIITNYSTFFKKYYIFACKEFDTSFLDKTGEKYEKFIMPNETELIKYYIRWVKNMSIDILSGWNINGYDIPYLVNRSEKLLGKYQEENEKLEELKEKLKTCSKVMKPDIEEQIRVFTNITKDKYIKKMSPVGVIKEIDNVDKKTGNKSRRYFFPGMNIIDMLEVYKTYTFSGKESYSLDYIASEEIGANKIKYEGSIAELYRNDWQKYVEYNIQDVRLLDQLNNQLGYLNLLVTFCYGCRVPFELYQKTTAVLDGAFVSKLYEERTVLPDVDRKIERNSYPGGYVKQPEVGANEWVASFDATSLYPSIMMGWNISPETKKAHIHIDISDCESSDEKATRIRENMIPIFKYLQGDKSHAEDKVILVVKDRQIEITIRKLISIKDKNDFSMSSNGVFYDKKNIGVVPRFVKQWFDERKKYKKLMIDAKSKGDKEKVQFYNLLQLNYKILINSVYGYVGTRFSRLYDLDNASAVTMTGQMITIRTINCLNEHFSIDWQTSEKGKEIKANNFENFVVYSDTDSVYVNCGKLLKNTNFIPREPTDEEIKIMEQKYEVPIEKDGQNIIFKFEKDGKKNWVQQSLNEAYTVYYLIEHFEKYIQDIIETEMIKMSCDECNCLENKIFFKRECIAKRVLFVEKKKYAMLVYNDEGDIPINKMKVTGLAIVRSDTPSFVRSVLKDVTLNILKYADREKTVDEINTIRNQFMIEPVEKISSTKPCNNLEKYLTNFNNGRKEQKVRGKIIKIDALESDQVEEGEFKQTPIHVRGAILYNELLSKNKKLQREYDFIYEGDKLKFIYMKQNNKWEHDIFSFRDKFPEKFGLQDLVDREKQFDVTVISPIQKFFNVLNWDLPKFDHNDIMSLFL